MTSQTRSPKHALTAPTTSPPPDRVVLTPVSRGDDFTVLRLDRKAVIAPKEQKAMHVAGGGNEGLVVNRQLSDGQSRSSYRIIFRTSFSYDYNQLKTDEAESGQPEVQLEFKVYLVNAKTELHTLESRKLQFWFCNDVENDSSLSNRMSQGHHFFRDLVTPSEFPRGQLNAGASLRPSSA